MKRHFWRPPPVSFFALVIGSLISVCFFMSDTANALQTIPYKMNFQGRLAETSGIAMPDGTYNMRFRIYSGASCTTGCTASWTEDRLVSAGNGVTVTNGLFSVQLGDVAALSPSLFSTQDLYFEVELPTPSTATTTSPSWTEGAMTPRNKLGSAAYAFNADTLDGLDSTAFASATGANGYIQNTSSPQTASFNITGTGTVGGSLTVNGGASISAPPKFFNDGFEDNTLAPFVSSSPIPWTITTTTPKTGTYAAVSGAITDNGTTSMTLTTNVTESATLAFAYKVSSEADYDFFYFYIDGVMKGSWSGIIDWKTISYPLSAGSHTFEWRYTKDSISSAGSDNVMIDDVTITLASGANALSLSGDASIQGNAAVTGTLSSAVLTTPIIRPTTDSSTALQVQNATGTTSLMVFDTNSSRVIIGSLTNGVTLSGSGVYLSGNARGNYTQTLSPEYPGAAFTPDGTNNGGNLTSDFCSGTLGINATNCANQSHNYYEWASTTTATADYDIYVRYQMPSNYSAGSMTNLKIWGYGTSTSTEQVVISMINNAGTVCSTSSNAVTAATTWAQATISAPIGSCTINPGDTVTFRVHVQAGTATANVARAGEITFSYRSTF